MRTLLIALLLLLLAGAARAQDRDSSNPLYIAAILVDEPADADMADLCAYYGYIEAPTSDGYRLFTSPEGTELRYKLTGPDNAPLITVEVNNLPDKKELPNLLTSIGFQPDKTPNTYLKGNRLFRRYTTCEIRGGRALLTKHLGVNPTPREGDPTKNTATRRKLRKSTAPQGNE